MRDRLTSAQHVRLYSLGAVLWAGSEQAAARQTGPAFLAGCCRGAAGVVTGVRLLMVILLTLLLFRIISVIFLFYILRHAINGKKKIKTKQHPPPTGHTQS